MKSEILVIAEAVLANIRVLEMLIHKLPDADRAAVAEKVQAANPTPAPMPVATPAAPVPAPVVAAPAAPTPAPIPAAPVIPVVTAAPAPVSASPSNAVPFTTQKELITYVMAKYKELGPTKGAQIQEVMNTLGIKNINEVNPAMYKPFFDGVEALK